jgi:hypothetical protein
MSRPSQENAVFAPNFLLLKLNRNMAPQVITVGMRLAAMTAVLTIGTVASKL